MMCATGCHDDSPCKVTERRHLDLWQPRGYNRHTRSCGPNEWVRWGLNPRPADYESAALTG